MSLLTIMPAGKTIETPAGTPLLQALQSAGEKLVCRCAEGKTADCHVFVVEGRKSVSRMTPDENGKLDTIIGIGSKSRLACLTMMGGEPVTVELLGALSGA